MMRERSVAVLGAGTMGHGIAQVFAAAGCRVALYDSDPDAPGRAVDRIGGNLDRAVRAGKSTPDAREAAMTRLRPESDLREAVADVDVVVECAPESLVLKQSIFRDLEVLVHPDTLLATNTSSLSIGEIAAALLRPERFLGLHFFNPAHVMPLVEVVKGAATDAQHLDRAVQFVREAGKEPIVVSDSPGFASSRLGVLLGLEAIRMVEEGVADVESIDRAMELGYRHPMGPLRLTDLVGLDVRLAIAEYLHERLGSDAFRPPGLLRRMVAEGRLGRKTGEGFYRWEEQL
jgi:3-hydroxybutyryl-CoA dehydrogenase